MSSYIEKLINGKNRYNKKNAYKVEDKTYKIVGIGPQALKVLWLGDTPGVKENTWNQCWWNYKNIDEVGKKVVIEAVKTLEGKKEKEEQTFPF